MKLRELMTRNVMVVSPNDTIQEAARKMARADVGVLPVIEGEGVVGTITDRDIAIRGAAEGLNPRKTSVDQIMTSPVKTMFEDQEVTDAVQLMHDNRIGRLPIVDRSYHLRGIVSLGDLATKAKQENMTDPVLNALGAVSHSRLTQA